MLNLYLREFIYNSLTEVIRFTNEQKIKLIQGIIFKSAHRERHCKNDIWIIFSYRRDLWMNSTGIKLSIEFPSYY